MVGSTIASGDQSGTDVSGRPLFPALFVTDVTATGDPLAGDWQNGGTAITPSAVFGTWKGAVKIVDNKHSPATRTVTPDTDPSQNHWNLGPGSDPVPPGLVDQGYGAEVRWDLSTLNLISGHQYRLYFMVHDGDQNKTGGDAGQGCVTFTMPGTAPTPTPGVSPTPTPTPVATPTPTPGCPPITVNPATLPAVQVSHSYHQNITASGGSNPYTFTVSGGSLPAGLNLSTAGVLSGTPTMSGSFIFTVQARDSHNCTGTRQYTLAVNCPPDLKINPDNLGDGKRNQSYNKTLTGDHGTAPYTFMLTSGSLPPGVTLTSAGVLSGTPTVAATYTFTVKMTDSTGCMVSKDYTLKVKN
jgi:hypothetical protein